MSEKVGSIYVEASIDTTGAIQAGKAIAKTADEIAADMQRIATAAEQAAAEQNKLAIAADNLAKAQSQAAAQSAKAASASQSITQALQSQRDSVNAYIEALRTENETLGLSQAELNAYRLAKLAASDAEQKVAANLQAQIDAFRQNSAAIEAAKAQTLQNKNTVDQMIAALKEQAATLGMNARQLILYKAAQAGASTEDKKAIIQSLNQIDNYRKKEEATRKAAAALQAESAATNSAQKSMGGLRGVAGNLGFQLQDVAVQAQAGTSAFTILGQQGSQLASSFGPGGAVLGAVIAIASAIGGVLYTSLKNASGAMKELPEEMQKQLEEIKKRYSEIDEASRAAFTQAELGKLNTQYEKQLKVVTDLRSAVATYSAEASKGSQGAAVAAGQYALRLKSAEAELLNIGKLQARVGEELAGANVTGKLEDGLKDSTSAAEQLTAQLQASILKLTEGELAARRYAAAQALGLTAAEQLPPEIDAAIVKLTELESAERRVTEQKRQQVEFQRESRAELDRELQTELQALSEKEKAQQKAISDREKLASQVSSIGLTPEQQAAQQYQREVDLLRQANEQKLLTEQQYQERLLVLRQQYEAKSGTGLFSTLSESLAGLQNQVSGTFAQMALGFEDSDKLAQRLSQTIFTELIGATINWGIQQAIAYAQGVAGEGAKAAAAVAANTTATGTAVTGLGVVTAAALTSAGAIAAAMAPAAALTSLATAGANAAPATAGILATTGVAEGVALSAAALGGKLYGGPVQPGSMYPITEDGRPEILRQGNRQYLLPGSRGGEVISNKDMQAAGSGVGSGTVVNINNYTGENVTQTRQQGPSGQEIINVVVGDIQKRGQIHSAITRNTTAGNRTL